MRFQTPQFIDVEDKMIGPLTLRQFIYLAGCGALSFMAFKFLPVYVALLLAAPLVALGFALAFFKVNNKPFIFVVESALKYFSGHKLYIWKKMPREVVPGMEKEEDPLSIFIPKLSDSKLKDLTWSLDVKQSASPALRDSKK